MKMSDGEKLIAVMLADVIQHLGIEGEIEPDFVKTAIFGDDLWALKWKYHGLFHQEGPDDETVEETGKIMTMCRVFENSVAQLDEAELAQIDERDRIAFRGFDGNEDPHYGVANMLVEHMNSYDEFASRPLNSHSRVLPTYRGMLKAYRQMDFSINGALSLDDLKAIIEAGRRG